MAFWRASFPGRPLTSDWDYYHDKERFDIIDRWNRMSTKYTVPCNRRIIDLHVFLFVFVCIDLSFYWDIYLNISVIIVLIARNWSMTVLFLLLLVHVRTNAVKLPPTRTHSHTSIPRTHAIIMEDWRERKLKKKLSFNLMIVKVIHHTINTQNHWICMFPCIFT